MNRFAEKLAAHSLPLRHSKTEVLQINLGKLCNLTCIHCHVNAGPRRKEIMTRETIDRIFAWLEKTPISTVDLTGGAPEMIPDFRYFVDLLRTIQPPIRIIDRCNLAILLERGQESLAEFLATRKVEIVAAMPFYSPENVNLQRGHGVFDKSIKALRLLNRLGYGVAGELPLHLVYNPAGPVLPAVQARLEADFKRELASHYGIIFNKLYTETNLPVGRFAAVLKLQGRLEAYMDLLVNSFNAATVDGLMCRNTINVGWQGEVYDCDFNQQLGMQWENGQKKFLWDVDLNSVEDREIMTGDHCFGCAAGARSGCGGELVQTSLATMLI